VSCSVPAPGTHLKSRDSCSCRDKARKKGGSRRVVPGHNVQDQGTAGRQIWREEGDAHYLARCSPTPVHASYPLAIFFGELITNSVPAWTCHRVNTNLLRTCQAPSQDRDGFHLVSAGPTTWIDISSQRKLHAHPHFSGR